MEFIVFLLMIVFFLTLGKQEAKKKGNQNAQPAKAAKPARPAAKPRAAKPRAAAPEAVVARAAAFEQGHSGHDAEGCVGGSMEHAHTEGESRAEHSRHVEAQRQREAEEHRAAQLAGELAAMNVRRMRQAVVMAEILDKPKALRRKT